MVSSEHGKKLQEIGKIAKSKVLPLYLRNLRAQCYKPTVVRAAA